MAVRNSIQDSVLLAVAAALAMGVLAPQGAALAAYSLPFLMVMMFFAFIGMELRIPGRSGPLFAILSSFVAVPLAAFLLASAAGLPGDFILGLLIASAMPTGISVVYLARAFGGDGSTVLASAAVSTLLAPALTPAAVYLLAGAQVQIDLLLMFRTLVVAVAIPFLASLAFRKGAKRLKEHSIAVSTAMSFLLVWGLTAQGLSYINTSGSIVLLALVVFAANLFAYGFGYLAGRQGSKGRAVSFFLISGFKNNTLGLALASALSPLAVMPAVVWLIVNNALLALVRVFR